ALLITLDLLEGKVTAADMDFKAAVPDHARDALVRGKWDAIADLLENVPAIRQVAATLPYFKTA
ncbi:MAG: hypothetical protein WCE49_18795, partial [Terrimicrobiaceae bacterium]